MRTVETESRMFCKRCLLRDISKDDYFKNIFELIESLDEDIKAPEVLYNERLTVCQGCDSLINGMCKICGCFVELRAATKKNYCPDINRHW